jgi:hypothetical protein
MTTYPTVITVFINRLQKDSADTSRPSSPNLAMGEPGHLNHMLDLTETRQCYTSNSVWLLAAIIDLFVCLFVWFNVRQHTITAI